MMKLKKLLCVVAGLVCLTLASCNKDVDLQGVLWQGESGKSRVDMILTSSGHGVFFFVLEIENEILPVGVPVEFVYTMDGTEGTIHLTPSGMYDAASFSSTEMHFSYDAKSNSIEFKLELSSVQLTYILSEHSLCADVPDLTGTEWKREMVLENGDSIFVHLSFNTEHGGEEYLRLRHAASGEIDESTWSVEYTYTQGVGVCSFEDGYTDGEVYQSFTQYGGFYLTDRSRMVLMNPLEFELQTI